MVCTNYDEENEQCNYYTALLGTSEMPPTGMDSMFGRCDALTDAGDWEDVEDESCDMFNPS